MAEETNTEEVVETEAVETTEGDAPESDISQNEESVGSESEGDIPDVPYDRFKEVISERNSLRDQASQLNNQITKLRQTPGKEATEKTFDDDSLDAVIRERAENGNPVTYEELGQMYFDKFQNMQQQIQKEAQQKVDKEVKALYDKNLIKTKEDENAVLSFAIKKSEEIGQEIPLEVAATWMKDANVRSEEPKEVSKKVQSSRKSDGASKPQRNYARDVKSKDLDEIIMDAKSELSK